MSSWLKVSADIAIALVPKVGSQSIRQAQPFIFGSLLIDDTVASVLAMRVLSVLRVGNVHGGGI